MPSVSVFLTDIVNEYRKENIENLSKFVQDKIQDQMEYREYKNKETRNDKRKILGQALMFMVIGMGFLSMGVAFFQDSAYLYPSIFLLAIGVITTIFGLIGMIEQMIKNKVEKNLEIQKTILGG